MTASANRIGHPSPHHPCPAQVCECVVILRNLKDVSWAGAKAMMSDGNFLRSLVDFDKDGLSEKQVGGRPKLLLLHV